MKKFLSGFLSMLLCFITVPVTALAVTIESNPVVSESGPTQNGPAFTLKKSTDYSEFSPGDIINYTVEVGIPSNVQPNPNTVVITDTLEDGATLVESSVNVSFKAYLGEPGIPGMWPTELMPANISTTTNSFEISFANKLDCPQTIKITYQVKINENFKGKTLTNSAHFKNTWFGSEANVTTTVNVIQPPEYTVTLPGTKTLDGKSENLPEFDFILEQSYAGLPVPAGDPFESLPNKQLIVHNAANGSIPNFFEGIIWTNPGDYWYSIKEVQTNPDDYEYDTTSYLVCVHVYNNMNPILEVYKGYYKTDAVKFANTTKAKFAQLTIKKEVQYSNLIPDPNTEFTIHLTAGDMDEDITIKANEEKTITIPAGSFTLEEINIPEHFEFVQWNLNSTTSDDIIITGNAAADGEYTATVTNKYWSMFTGDFTFPSVDPQAYLVLSKEVDVSDGIKGLYNHWNKQDDTFIFEVTLTGKTTTYTLKAGEQVLIPVTKGTIFTIKEILADDSEYSIKNIHYTNELNDNINKDNADQIMGRISTATTEVTYTNEWHFTIQGEQLPEFGQEEDYNPQPLPPVFEEVKIYGSLTVSKNVDTNLQYLYDYWNKADDVFTFEVTIGNKTETIYLKAGESKTFDNILVNTIYSIKEINLPAGYSTDNDSANGMISLVQRNHEVTITNNWTYVPEVGTFPEFGQEEDYNPQPIPPVFEEVKVYGSITLSKIVNTNLQSLYDYWNKKQDDFTVRVTLDGISQNIKIKAGEIHILEKIPVDTEYTIEEIDIPDGYTLQSENKVEGKVTLDNRYHTVTIVNNWEYTPEIGDLPNFEVIPQGNLTISKNMIDLDSSFDPDTIFTFKVKIGTYETTVTLKNNETWVSPKFDESTEYYVVETDLPDNTAFHGVKVNNSYFDYHDVKGKITTANTDITYINQYQPPKNNESQSPSTDVDKEEENNNDNNNTQIANPDSSLDKNDSPKKENEVIQPQEQQDNEKITVEHVLAQTGDDNTIWMWLCGIAVLALIVMVVFYFRDLT